MGIQGLLPLLKECQRVAHLKEYSGQTLGIDAYVWLHRGAYGCAQEIATGQQTVKYVKYAMHRIRLLKHHGITPYVVFDGGLLPSKQGTEKDREGRRNEALAQARALTIEGKHGQARDCYVKAVDVTPQMAYQLIKALIAENVAYVVAPYEADAQLAYLEKKSIIDGIITEDSDLLVFGCRKVLFKLDSDGQCVEVRRETFTMCKEFSFSGWTDKEFRQMAILSGCDYLESIQGLGLKTAHRLMRRYKTAEKVIRYIRLEGQMKVPRNYEEEYKRAELTFLHQRVFCPTEQKLVHLEDLPDHVLASLKSPQAEELRFIGPYLTDDIALGIAKGDLCPLSKAKMVDIAPDAEVLATKPLAMRSQSATLANGKNSSPSIKDFFKPKPAALNDKTKQSTSRDILAEVKPNNMFASRKESTGSAGTNESSSIQGQCQGKENARPVKSRFFAPSGKSKPTCVDGRTSVTFASGSTSKQAYPVEIIQDPPNTDLTAQEQITQIQQDLSCLDTRVPLAAQVLPAADDLDMHIMDFVIPSPEDCAKVAGSMTGDLSHIRPDDLPPMPTPQKASEAPVEPFSETGFSHISSPQSSPQASPRPRKLRRYKSLTAEPISEGDKENDASMEPSASISSHEQAVPSGKGQACKKTKLPEMLSSSSSQAIDLTDLSSSPPAQQHAEQAVSKRRGQKRPLRLSSSSIEELCVDDSRESLWPDEAQTPPSAGIDEVQNLDIALPGASQSSSSSKAIPRQADISKAVKKAKVKMSRANAVILSTSAVGSDDIPDEDEKYRMDAFDQRLKTVMNGWRSKFSAEDDKLSHKKSRSSTPKLKPSTTSKSKIVVKGLDKPPQRQIHTAEVSSPILSSPPQDLKNGSTMRVGDASKRVPLNNLPLASVTNDTTSRLDAFRFRPPSS